MLFSLKNEMHKLTSMRPIYNQSVKKENVIETKKMECIWS